MDDDDLAALHEYTRAQELGGNGHYDEEGDDSTGNDDSFEALLNFLLTSVICTQRAWSKQNMKLRPKEGGLSIGYAIRFNTMLETRKQAFTSRHFPIVLLNTSIAPALPHLREISSLASWAVSSYKPGCGVSALRHPSPSFYWQSDGPQPHTLNIHFFKLVSIVHIRIYLNFELDESYTPTRLIFLAGTGHHDLQVVREMDLRQPKGWFDVDLSTAGGPSAVEEGIANPDNDEDGDEPPGMSDEDLRMGKERARRKIGTGQSLRCFLVQLRILENHHNGKDTHLRGLQIFAPDNSKSRHVFGSYSRATNQSTLAGAKPTRVAHIKGPLGAPDDADILDAIIR